MKILDSNEIVRRVGEKHIRVCQIIMLTLFIDVIALRFFSEYKVMQIINIIIFICLIINAGMVIYKLLKYKPTK